MTQVEREQAIEVLQAKIDSIEDDQAYSQLSKSMYEDGYRRIDACKAAIAALREPEWVRTADRLPTEADAGVDEKILTIYDDGETRVMGTDYWAYVAMVPEVFPYWLPVPKLPEVEE